MSKLKDALIYAGAGLLAFGAMAAMPGQEVVSILLVFAGIALFSSVGVIEYFEYRREL